MLQTTPAKTQAATLLDVADLRTYFYLRHGILKAVDGVSFHLKPHETLAIVGESGCGKSMTALSLMRLIPEPPGKIVSGSVKLAGRDLIALDESAMRHVRGKDISMIFQEPMTSLNPVMTVGNQIAEALLLHEGLNYRQALARAVEILKLVRIPEAERRLKEYPHQLSGGMRQRVMIAMALACNPKVLIADEPTTALDVTIQAQILDLMRDLKRTSDAAIILITHDLGVVAEVCDEVAVMYAGEIVERAPADALFEAPEHPYTLGLLASIPRLDERTERLAAIDGVLPDMTAPPIGCRFADRCPFVLEDCRAAPPPVVDLGGRWTRCLRAPLERLVRDPEKWEPFSDKIMHPRKLSP
jgi:peptide/nickel transport system ATP-binding protein